MDGKIIIPKPPQPPPENVCRDCKFFFYRRADQASRLIATRGRCGLERCDPLVDSEPIRGETEGCEKFEPKGKTDGKKED